MKIRILGVHRNELTRINRNIVECKYGSIKVAGCSSGSVLIETLWNVNYVVLFPVVQRYSSINRNIVECKFKSFAAEN